MSISDRSFDSRLSYGSKVNPVIILIAISMIIFVVLAFFRALTYLKLPEGGDVAGYFDEHILGWFALSEKPGNLLGRPWTIFTYSFTYINAWALFGSLVWLWCFGYILIDLTGFRKIVPVFLYGTLAGALAFLVSGAFLSSAAMAPGYLLGGSAAVLAVCAAATTICPNYKVFPMLGGGLSLWILSIIYLVIDMATLPSNNPVLYISHLAGALSGFLFVYILRKGFDGSEWMNRMYDSLMNLYNPEEKAHKANRIKSTLFYNATKKPYSKTLKLTQQKVDELLDKINLKGYESLSAEEKEFLERASREDVKDK